MTEFVIGCTHFGHSAIIKHRRQFESVKDMDAALIDNWNAVVKPQDTVYHLGDFSGWEAHPHAYTPYLTGNIVTLQGNHDPKGWGDHLREVRINRRKVVLCHYPIEEWNGWHTGALHIHAHTHKKKLVSAVRRAHVGADATGFTPLRLDEVVKTLLEWEAIPEGGP